MKPRKLERDISIKVIIRQGVTLAEVLVSMAIMSIGVVLLSTLLPISILRTAQATQLTQAVFLRNNAEAILESSTLPTASAVPGLLSNSQIPFLPNTTSRFAVIDPLGSALVTPAQPFGGTILRTSGGAASLQQAEALAQLPDSWNTVVPETPVTPNLAANPPNVTFSGSSMTGLNIRNSQVANLQNAPHRLVLFDATGKFAVIEPLLQVSGNNMSWWDPNNTLANPGATVPTGFVPARGRIEVMERRFSWMMTVRKKLIATGFNDGSWAAEISVAVFYNRSFNPNDETPLAISPVPLGFDGLPGVAGVDDDGQNGTDDSAGETGWLGSDDNRTVTVSWPTAGSPPLLKKGGYMLEPTQLKWYRIVNLTNITPSSVSAMILLDQDLRSTPAIPVTQGIFMKGIIEVYALGNRTGQQ